MSAHQSPNGGCLLCSIPHSVGNWAVHAAGKRHQAAVAAAGQNADGALDAPPLAKKPRLGASPSPAPAARARSPSPPRLTQTDAMREFRLSKEELNKLNCRLAPNPHRKRGAAMRLFLVSEVEALSMAKHGDTEGLAAAKAKSVARSAKAAATRAHNDGWRVGANPATWSVATHDQFTPQFRAGVSTFLLCAHRLRLFGGADSFAELSQRVVSLMVTAVPPRPNQLAKKVRQRSTHGHRLLSYEDYYRGDDDFDSDEEDGYDFY
jgi:hypothetical protein